MFMSKTTATEPRRKAPLGFTRRVALAAGVMAPFLMKAAKAANPREEIVEALVDRSERQAQLFNAGEMERWLEVIQLSNDFTLMQPFGGAADYGFDASPEHLAQMSQAFRNGDASLELVQVVASDDMVMLAYVERQDGEVYGLPMQDWSLRVTQVFKREGTEWKLRHRHADPLVRRISLHEAAALAAGRDLARAQAGEAAASPTSDLPEVDHSSS
jgi:ketosteroid isomerase-like protein